MSGILAYDLAGYHCEECGWPKINRLFGYLTDCETCNTVIKENRWKPIQPLRNRLPRG